MKKVPNTAIEYEEKNGEQIPYVIKTVAGYTNKVNIKILKQNEKCDLVICLSHLGFKYQNDPEKICDVRLAKQTKDIDLIIGGHTHTFLDKPVTETNAEGKEVLINQVGCYGINLGRIDFYFDKAKDKTDHYVNLHGIYIKYK